MKILSLVAENILKLKAIHIVPKSEVIEIKGENAMGKSSVLDAIVIGLKGKKSAPAEPVKKGSKKGKIVIEMDGDKSLGIPPFTITSKVSNDKIETFIEPKEILDNETPRSFLDKILGAISFDPLEFINREGQQQRKALLELIGVDVTAWDLKEKQIFDDRTIKNRDLKTAEIKVKSLKQWVDVTETEEVKMVDLSKKLTDAIAFNQEIKNRGAINESLKQTALNLKDQDIPDCKKKIAALEQDLAETKERLVGLEKSLDSIRVDYQKEKTAIATLQPIDVETINTEIEEIETKNSKIRDNATYKKEIEALGTIKSAAKSLDTKLEKCRADRLALLQGIKMPVDGLSFDDEGLLYNNILLAQCSDGEKLMVSMGISMALNPTMRLLRIKDGSLLGPKNTAILRSMVKDKGYQLWIEKVMDKDQYNKTGKIGIFIEEGEAEGEEIVVDSIVEETEDKLTEKKLSKKELKPKQFTLPKNLPDDDF